jgi:hypothetical protein
MNLILVLLLLVAAWLIYTTMQSYNAMARELREIRMKCIQTQNVSIDSTEPVHPYTQMKETMMDTLQRISNKLNA